MNDFFSILTNQSRDPSPLMTRDTYFLVTRGTYSHPDYPIRISPRVHVARFSYPDFLREKHTTLANITSGRSSYHIRTTDISYSDMFVRIIDWSKQVLHVIITACHGPRSATCRVRSQEWSDGKSLPTISDSCGASHHLCQPPYEWWWPCHHLEASWQAKISPYH